MQFRNLNYADLDLAEAPANRRMLLSRAELIAMRWRQAISVATEGPPTPLPRLHHRVDHSPSVLANLPPHRPPRASGTWLVCLGLESMLHMTCVGSTKDEVTANLNKAKNLGIRNILGTVTNLKGLSTKFISGEAVLKTETRTGTALDIRVQ